MSHLDLFHIEKGRIPWRPWVQLRSKPGASAVRQHPDSQSLSIAARKLALRGMNQEWQWQDALQRTVIAADWIGKRLNRPLRIRNIDQHATRIEVFGSWVFNVNRAEGHLSCASLTHGFESPYNYSFVVSKPLESSTWIRAALQNMGLAWSSQRELFYDFRNEHSMVNWIISNLYSLLVRQPEFQKLRISTLPKAFGIPLDIYSIALAARLCPQGPLLTSHTLNIVWQNARAFRLIARENPQLIPLLFALIVDDKCDSQHASTDPAAALKSEFMSAGLSDAAWRYVTRHGSRLFRTTWLHYEQVSPLTNAILYLSALDYAGLPPPPPPSVARALLHLHDEHCEYASWDAPKFDKFIDLPALRAGLLEAHARRGQPNMAEFVDDFMGVCLWSGEDIRFPDKNQTKAGWPWFLRQFRHAEAEKAALDPATRKTWKTRLQAFDHGRWHVVPILSSSELAFEAWAMRNCLESYLDDCESGKVEIYSVRDRETGKRRACIGLRFDRNRVRLEDITGFANTPAPEDIRQIGREMLRRSAIHATSVQSAVTASDGFRQTISELDS